MRHELIYNKDDVAVLQIIGQIEYEDRDVFSTQLNKLTEQEKRLIFLDLASTNYIGSAGIGVIAQFHKRFNSKGYNFYLLNTQEEIKKIFQNIGLGNIINFAEGAYEDVIKETRL